MTPDALLDFWFSERVRPYWFRKSDEFDAEVRERFEATFEAARDGRLASWAETPDGALALVVALDQLPRNLFRGDPRSWATDPRALAAAEAAIDRGFAERIPDDRRAMLYMPFMHAESREAQARAIELFSDPALAQNLRFAHAHKDIVDRFGRFPHRNAVLGRESTPEELAFLQEPGSSF